MYIKYCRRHPSLPPRLNAKIGQGWNVQAIHKILFGESGESVCRRLEWSSISICSSPNDMECDVTHGIRAIAILLWFFADSSSSKVILHSIVSIVFSATSLVPAKDAAVIPRDPFHNSVVNFDYGGHCRRDRLPLCVVIPFLQGIWFLWWNMQCNAIVKTFKLTNALPNQLLIRRRDNESWKLIGNWSKAQSEVKDRFEIPI